MSHQNFAKDWDVIMRARPQGYAQINIGNGEALFGPVTKFIINSVGLIEVHVAWVIKRTTSGEDADETTWEVVSGRPCIITRISSYFTPCSIEDMEDGGRRVRFGKNTISYEMYELSINPSIILGLTG